MIIFTSPIYYFAMTAQMEAAIQRVYCIVKPLNAQKASLRLTSGPPGVYDVAITQFKSYMVFSVLRLQGSLQPTAMKTKLKPS